MNKSRLKCLFGYHDYTVLHKTLANTLICGVCHNYAYLSWKKYQEWYKLRNGYWSRYQYQLPSGVIMRLDDGPNSRWYRYSL